MMTTEHEIDPYQIDPLKYLAKLDGHHTGEESYEHYQALRPALLRLQRENLPAFDVALREIATKLKIKGQTIRNDLALLTPPPTPKCATELLEAMGQTRSLRLAQDFLDGQMWFGVIAGDQKVLLNSDRKLLTLDHVPEGLRVKDYGFDLCRLSKDAVLRFMGGELAADITLLTDLQEFFARFAVFRDRRLPLLLATWTLGTYCYRVFRVFPYLVLRSPEKRCGKSRVLDELSLVAFNASGRVVYPTEAQLFRGPSRNGGTLLLDEIEALGRADKDMYAGLLAVLNSGFEQGGSVFRLEKTASGNFQEVRFETYCPRAIAGINKLAETLEDRAIIIGMQRKLSRERTERFSPSRLEPLAQTLRDRCYLWALSHAEDLAEVYEAADHTFSDLESLDDRARDLWEPLAAIAAVCDVEHGEANRTMTTELVTLAQDLCQVREGAAEDSTVVQVVKGLHAIVAHTRLDERSSPEGAIILTPTELAEQLRGRLGWERLSAKTLAALVNPLGLVSRSTKREGKVVKAYHLRAQDLAELSERYVPSDASDGEKT